MFLLQHYVMLHSERISDLDGLRTRLAVDAAYMEAVATKTMGVYFSAFRSHLTSRAVIVFS